MTIGRDFQAKHGLLLKTNHPICKGGKPDIFIHGVSVSSIMYPVYFQ